MSRSKVEKEEILKSLKLDLKSTFDEIAEDFDRTRSKPWKECIEFAKTIPKDSIVLDIGCGNGRNMILFSENKRVIGLDISRNMVQTAKKNLMKKNLSHKCDLLQSDAVHLPIKESSIDVILYIATLHHISTADERLRSLLELKRTLRKGGRALISVWAFDQPKFEELLKEHLKKKEGFGDVDVEWKGSDGRTFKRFYHLFYGEELKDLALKAELTIKEYYKSNNNYYAVVDNDSKD